MTPMTAAAGMGPLPSLVRRFAGEAALRRVFDRADLPIAVASQPRRKIPLASLIQLFEESARVTGDPQFGLHVGNAMGDGFGVWARYAVSAPDLYSFLMRMSRSIRYHQSGTRLTVTRHGDLAKFSYHLGLRSPVGNARHHLEHTIPALLDGFRKYGGRDWAPTRIEVAYATGHRALENALGLEVHDDADAFAIVFPVTDLDRRLIGGWHAGGQVTRHDLKMMIRQQAPRSTAGVVEAMIGLRLLDGRADVDGIAERLRISVRTLQRKLGEENRSYRDILAAVRTDQARALLAETDLPVTDIAFALGYEDPAHFTRAFRRAVSVSPRTYRAHAAQVSDTPTTAPTP